MQITNSQCKAKTVNFSLFEQFDEPSPLTFEFPLFQTEIMSSPGFLSVCDSPYIELGNSVNDSSQISLKRSSNSQISKTQKTHKEPDQPITPEMYPDGKGEEMKNF